MPKILRPAEVEHSWTVAQRRSINQVSIDIWYWYDRPIEISSLCQAFPYLVPGEFKLLSSAVAAVCLASTLISVWIPELKSIQTIRKNSSQTLDGKSVMLRSCFEPVALDAQIKAMRQCDNASCPVTSNMLPLLVRDVLASCVAGSCDSVIQNSPRHQNPKTIQNPRNISGADA